MIKIKWINKSVNLVLVVSKDYKVAEFQNDFFKNVCNFFNFLNIKILN